MFDMMKLKNGGRFKHKKTTCLNFLLMIFNRYLSFQPSTLKAKFVIVYLYVIVYCIVYIVH